MSRLLGGLLHHTHDNSAGADYTGPSSGGRVSDVVSAYAVAAVLWFWYGIQQHDIYLPCEGWVVLDAAVILGVRIYG
jgi:hypothetical protein